MTRDYLSRLCKNSESKMSNSDDVRYDYQHHEVPGRFGGTSWWSLHSIGPCVSLYISVYPWHSTGPCIYLYIPMLGTITRTTRCLGRSGGTTWWSWPSTGRSPSRSSWTWSGKTLWRCWSITSQPLLFSASRGPVISPGKGMLASFQSGTKLKKYVWKKCLVVYDMQQQLNQSLYHLGYSTLYRTFSSHNR